MSSKKMFVNVYEVSRELGGREEGGWYYDEYTPIKSIRVPQSVAYAVAAKLEKRPEFSNAGRRPLSSVLSDGRVVVLVEAGPGRDTTPPSYC